MSDIDEIETVLTDHLARRATEAQPRHALDQILEEEPAPRLHVVPLGRNTNRRRWVATAGIAAGLLAIAGAAVVLGRSEPTEVEIGPAGSPTTPPGPGPESLSVPLATDRELPDRGFAVIGDEGVTLYDAEGSALTTSEDSDIVSGWDDDGLLAALTVEEDEGTITLTPDRYEPGDYQLGGLGDEPCAELDSGPDGTVVTCRDDNDDSPFGRALQLIRPGGEAELLVGAIYGLGVYPGTDTSVLGHWAHAELSPDGEWVLAEWSGECEAPTAFVVRVADGAVFGPTGERMGQSDHIDDEPPWHESRILGWSGERALIDMSASDASCGAAPRNAVLSVDPVTGETTDLATLSEDGNDRVVPWHQG